MKGIGQLLNEDLRGIEQSLRAAGIPTDRVALVKRNVELQAKLNIAHATLRSVYRTLHETFGHDGAWESCEQKACTGLRDHAREVGAVTHG